MTTNFWGYIISGVQQVLLSLTSSFPQAAPNQLFDLIPDALSQVIAPVVFWSAPLFDLRLLLVAILIVGGLEAVRTVIAVLRWIYSLIPAAS
jgi:hypothetical protein